MYHTGAAQQPELMKLVFECVSTLCKHLVSHLILMLPEVRAPLSLHALWLKCSPRSDRVADPYQWHAARAVPARNGGTGGGAFGPIYHASFITPQGEFIIRIYLSIYLYPRSSLAMKSGHCCVQT